jgi:hypothetical protein
MYVWASKKKANYAETSLLVNQQAVEIRKNIEDKAKHKQIDTTQIIAGFINFCVGIATEKKCSIQSLKLQEIELILKTLGQFFLMIELTSMKMQPNDWEDFAILGYLRPGDKYWTKENRWIEIINQAGCNNYLFDENVLTPS